MTPYATVSDADDYFDEKLNNTIWINASDDRKLRALKEATLLIDNLAFSGSRVSEDQANEFPRIYVDAEGTEITQDDTPQAVKNACAEVAYSLLSGLDPIKEKSNLNKVRQSYDKTSVEYKSVPADYLNAMIINPIAWAFLLPYLESSKEINHYRV